MTRGFALIAATLLSGCAVLTLPSVIAIFRVGALPEPSRAQPIEWHPSAGESRGRRGLTLATPGRRDCPPDERDYYFWPGTFASSDEFRREHLTHFLRAAGQASLTCGPQEGDSQYRFTWLRTFRYPVVVRVWSSPGSYWLDGKELDGAGGYEPGAPMTSIRRRLNEHEWRVITAALARAGFWGMVTEGEVEGEDGANWVLEGRRGNAYHVVHRWSPDDGPFREACLTLLRVAGLMPVRDIY